MAFRSGFERTVTTNLTMRKVKWLYEKLKVPYLLSNTYNPDLELVDSGIIIEIKGLLSASDRRKHIAVREQHPELDIRFCFMDANKRMPGTKTSHKDWADRYGFKWCEGEIPDEWLKS